MPADLTCRCQKKKSQVGFDSLTYVHAHMLPYRRFIAPALHAPPLSPLTRTLGAGEKSPLKAPDENSHRRMKRLLSVFPPSKANGQVLTFQRQKCTLSLFFPGSCSMLSRSGMGFEDM